jgi:AcrR family transcriptional regulator
VGIGKLTRVSVAPISATDSRQKLASHVEGQLSKMDKIERRAQILARARDVFAKRGYHAAKIEDIVAAAKVARGTFYLYFEDKRGVFVELVDRFLAKLHLAILRIDPRDPSRSVAAQIRENIVRVLTLFLQDRAMTKILLTDAPGLDADFDRKLRAVYEEVLNLLAGSFTDTRVFAYLTVGAIKELLYQSVMLDFDDGSAERLTSEVFSFLCRGCLRIPGEV